MASPLLGSGIIPSGAIGTELTAVTRRAFIPKLIVQIYKASPLLAAFLANAQMASGGVSSITVPLQGTSMVTAQSAGYDGSFSQPAVVQGITEADFNLKLQITPIPFLGMEGAVQVSAAVIPLLEARMNDAGNATADFLATKLSNAANVNTNLDIWSLSDAISAGNPTAGNYGNVDATTNTWWQGNVKSVGGTPAPTRQLMLQYIASATKANTGEMPTFGVTGLGTWADLAQDFQGLERYNIGPGSSFDQSADGARSTFTALMVAGVPIYADPYLAEGTFYFFNERYWSAYFHEDAAFGFTGFASTLPNFQLGYVGALVNIMDIITVKRKSGTVVSGFASLTI